MAELGIMRPWVTEFGELSSSCGVGARMVGGPFETEVVKSNREQKRESLARRFISDAEDTIYNTRLPRQALYTAPCTAVSPWMNNTVADRDPTGHQQETESRAQ